MFTALALLLSSALAQVAMPGGLPEADYADFTCSYTFNGHQGTTWHTYTDECGPNEVYACEPGTMWLKMHTGPDTFDLTLRNPVAVSGGTRWRGRVTDPDTSLDCTVVIASDGSAIDYPSCSGTLNGNAVWQMAVSCDEN